jgi:hypothetical protein
VDTNEIISPIYLNHNIELPLLELHIDKDNFVVFTTKNIYNCRDTFNSVINYDDIIGIDEISLILSSSNTKIAQIFDILIVLSNGTSMPIKVEHGIPISCIVYFLITITKR